VVLCLAITTVTAFSMDFLAQDDLSMVLEDLKDEYSKRHEGRLLWMSLIAEYCRRLRTTSL
jgi:hypothetical protein